MHGNVTLARRRALVILVAIVVLVFLQNWRATFVESRA
jgi:multidrug efflux pump subunit AcrB